MSIFKKTCIDCGSKVDEVKEGLCYNCYSELNPPIKEIQETNLKICNECRRIHYNNAIFTIDEIKEMLPNILKKRIILNEGYKLESLNISDFKIKNSKISFDINAETNLL